MRPDAGGTGTLGFVVEAAEAGHRIVPVLADIAAVARPGDWVLCVDAARDPKTGTAIRIFEQMDGVAPGVQFRLLSADRPLAPGASWIRLGLSALAGEAPVPRPGHLLFLSGRVPPGAAALAHLRARILSRDVDIADLVAPGDPPGPESGPESGPIPGPDLIERQAFRTGVLLDLLREEDAADGPGDRGGTGYDLALAWRARTRSATRARIVLPDPSPDAPADLPDAGTAVATPLLMPVPETGPDFVAAALRLCARAGEDGPALAAWLCAQRPGRLAAAPAGLRRAIAADLDRAGILAPDAPQTAPEIAPEIAPRIETEPAPETAPEPAPGSAAAPPVSPAPGGRARLRVLLCGPHAHRTPLAYAALAPLWEAHAELVPDPARADLVVIAHPRDALTLSAEAAEALARGRPLALYSEEPFWDSLFSPDPAARSVILPTAHLGEARARQVTHHRGAAFDFDRIPYYLLTAAGFWLSYSARFARNARRTAADWRAHFAAVGARTVFMAERRPERFHDMVWPQAGIVGLCAWRTRLALACPGAERIGASWGTAPSRFALRDWHFDKLARLDAAVGTLSALENTHQPAYLSEKLFDAFACGARPLYMAAPGHRVHDLGLPPGAWLNLWGRDLAESARAAVTPPEGRFFEDYAAAQGRLAALFASLEVLRAERRRLGRAIRADLAAAAG